MKTNSTRLLFFMALVILGLTTGCMESKPSQRTPTTTSVAVETGQLPRMRGDFFSTSGECGFCHTGLKDSSGKDVSIETAWRTSVMANASRDPYYRASVRSEVLQKTDFGETITGKNAQSAIFQWHFRPPF